MPIYFFPMSFYRIHLQFPFVTSFLILHEYVILFILFDSTVFYSTYVSCISFIGKIKF